MNLSPREIALAWITILVLVFSVTFMAARRKLGDLRELKDEERAAAAKLAAARQLLDREESVRAEFGKLMLVVPQHAGGEDVTASLGQQLEVKAERHGITLKRRALDREERHGELYEIAIRCDWDANLEGLVRFMFDLQTPDAMLDIAELYVKPKGKTGVLQGRFTVNYAFSRRRAEPPPADKT